VVVEINTRRSEDRAEREFDVAEALAFTRLHLAAPAGSAAPAVPTASAGAPGDGTQVRGT
jgi:hypothetical protein